LGTQDASANAPRLYDCRQNLQPKWCKTVRKNANIRFGFFFSWDDTFYWGKRNTVQTSMSYDEGKWVGVRLCVETN